MASPGNEDCFRVEEDVNDLDLSRLSSEIEKRLNMSKVGAVLRSGKSLDILICGKTGCGKSTLVNGLIGVRLVESELAKEGSDSIEPCTSEVVEYSTKKDKIDITIWDTPGLIDGTGNEEEYLKDIEAKCPSVHIKLFCIDCSQTRFVKGRTNQDFEAMKRFTAAFGLEFWENIIIVLTMANLIEARRPRWKTLSMKEKRSKFIDVIDQFTAIIRFSLKDYVKLPEEVVEKIKVIPAGHYEDPKLPDRDYWLSDFYFECLDALPSPNSKGALLKLNLERLKTQEEVKDSDFDTEIELQPLVVSSGFFEEFILISERLPQTSPPVSSPDQKETADSLSQSLPPSNSSEKATPDRQSSQTAEDRIGEGGAAGIGGGVGAVVGGGLGAIGLLGGPLAFATIPAGAALGSALGAGLGYFTKRWTGSSTSSSSKTTQDENKS